MPSINQIIAERTGLGPRSARSYAQSVVLALLLPDQFDLPARAAEVFPGLEPEDPDFDDNFDLPDEDEVEVEAASEAPPPAPAAPLPAPEPSPLLGEPIDPAPGFTAPTDPLPSAPAPADEPVYDERMRRAAAQDPQVDVLSVLAQLRQELAELRAAPASQDLASVRALSRGAALGKARPK